jgi:hypothetical protein
MTRGLGVASTRSSSPCKPPYPVARPRLLAVEDHAQTLDRLLLQRLLLHRLVYQPRLPTLLDEQLRPSARPWPVVPTLVGNCSSVPADQLRPGTDLAAPETTPAFASFLIAFPRAGVALRAPPRSFGSAVIRDVAKYDKLSKVRGQRVERTARDGPREKTNADPQPRIGADSVQGPPPGTWSLRLLDRPRAQVSCA